MNQKFDILKDPIVSNTSLHAKWKQKPQSSTGGGASSGGGSGSPAPVTPPSTGTTVVPPKTTTPEVKGDEVVRPTTPIFTNFSKKCTQAVKDLTDPRLSDYYNALKVTNTTNLNRDLTRAEFLKLLLNSANIDVSAEADPSYTDVPSTHTLKQYIAYATRTHLVSGKNGKFRPDEVISRAEAAKIFVNAAALELSTEVNTFSDVSVADSLAKYIQTAYDNCLLNGRKTMGGETILANGVRVYEPTSPITLAETAKVLYNIQANK